MIDHAERFAGLSGRLYAVAPEEALLFLAARLSSPPEDDDRLRALCKRPLHWDAVQALCNRHGVTGLVRRRLLETGAWVHVPRPQRQAMDHWQLTRRSMHAAINSQLDELLGACAEQQIVPVVLKGAALAATVYPDPALRSMADIDLLVPVEAMPGLGEVMARLGYQRQGLYYTDEFNASHGYHLIFRHSAGRKLPIEVHWELASRPERRNRLTAATLLSHAISAPQCSDSTGWHRYARILTPEVQIVYAATHMASEGHAFGRLIWLVDLAGVLGTAPPPDWAATVRLVHRARARRATTFATTLASSLLGTAVPPGMTLTGLGDRLVAGFVDSALSPARLLHPVSAERRALVKYLILDGLGTTVRLGRERIVPGLAMIDTLYAPRGALEYGMAYVHHGTALGKTVLRKRISRSHKEPDLSADVR